VNIWPAITTWYFHKVRTFNMHSPRLFVALCKASDNGVAGLNLFMEDADGDWKYKGAMKFSDGRTEMVL
jgi:hypothetical protein